MRGDVSRPFGILGIPWGYISGVLRDWGFFRYKKRSISIQEFMIYHHISCLSHDISLYIIYEIMIYR
jgi:hypothetical protein